MRGNDISRRDASLAKRNTLFQAYGNIPQVIMIDLARVGSVLNQPAYSIVRTILTTPEWRPDGQLV